MSRAKEWTEDVEDAYRLQEAGYRDEREALSLGHPPIERWPGGAPLGCVRACVRASERACERPSGRGRVVAFEPAASRRCGN
eukprot:79797-Prymnesium_polylepis.2